ncbi:MAG: hypothetical protein KHX03_08250 [Clostridium sp.]|nr:hypothetical protein [Clostridium sp.]
MSISKINNSSTIFKTQNNLRNFHGTENMFNKHAIDDSSSQKLSSEEIYELASAQPNKILNKVVKNSLKTIIVGVPVVDSLFSGIAESGSLSQKVFKSARTMGKWGLVFASGAAVIGLKKFVNKHAETLDNFDKKNRAAAIGVDAAAFYAAMTTAFSMKNKTKSLLYKVFPDTAQKINTKLLKPIKRTLDFSVFNKKIVKPFEKYVSKKPYYKPVAKTTALLLAPAISIAAFCRVHNEAKKQRENVFVRYALLSYINNKTT